MLNNNACVHIENNHDVMLYNEHLRISHPSSNIWDFIQNSRIKHKNSSNLHTAKNNESKSDWKIGPFECDSVPFTVSDVILRTPRFFEGNSNRSDVEAIFIAGIRYWMIVLYVVNLL